MIRKGRNKITDEREYIQAVASLENKCIIYNETNDDNGVPEGLIIEVDQNTIDQLDAANKIINDFTLIKRKIVECRQNFLDVYDGINYWNEKLTVTGRQAQMELHESMYIDINRRFTNFTTSFKSLIEDFLMRRIIPKITDNDVDAIAKFKAFNDEWYHKNFGYRFCLKIRDYAIHYKMPIQVVGVDSDFNKDRLPKYKASLYVKMRQSTLREYAKLDRLFKAEGSKYNEYFPVFPVLEELEYVFDNIFKVVIDIFENTFLKSMGIIDDE